VAGAAGAAPGISNSIGSTENTPKMGRRQRGEIGRRRSPGTQHPITIDRGGAGGELAERPQSQGTLLKEIAPDTGRFPSFAKIPPCR